jgi:hypothetical protein
MSRPLTLLFLAATGMRAMIAPATAPIEPLFEQSDLVAAARCDSVVQKDSVQTGVQEGKPVPIDYLERYSVIKTYCGSAPAAGLTVLVTQREPAWGVPGCGPDIVLLFLRSEGAEAPYGLADPNFGIHYFPGPLAGASAQSGLDELESDCLRIAATGTSAQVKKALELLSDYLQVNKATVEGLSRLAVPSDPDAAVLRLEALARAEPGDYMERLIDQIHELRSSLLAMSSLTMIRACNVVQDKAEVQHLPGLEKLVNELPAQNPFVREMVVDNPFRVAAMRGIRRLKAPESVAFLVQHLDDPGKHVSYLALITLAELTHKGREFGPGMGPFEKSPQKYRDLWHRWWETEGSKEFPAR